jgi:glycosyltransferase involved in cell wall biosynthesis
MRSLAAELGIADHVRWLGWRADLQTFYQSLDVLLFNSDWDAMGRTPLEALANGIPVVASILNGGLTEILDPQRYGQIFTTHDIDGMASAIVSLLGNPDAAARLVTFGRSELERLASPSKHVDQVSTIMGV